MESRTKAIAELAIRASVLQQDRSDMASYIIARITIRDRDQYANYEAGFMEIFQQYAGRMLAVDEDPNIIEGDWPGTRTVLIEFPSKADALAWYESEAYQRLAQHRFASSKGDIVIIEGLSQS
jgi:uncharacterized protein (DUF1330 family)